VNWSSNRGGGGVSTGTSIWAATGIILQLGLNVITVTARDAAGNTTDVAITVTLNVQPVPTADSVSPSGGSGFMQSFTFVFSDSQSSTNLAAAAMLFASVLAPQNACFVVYDRNRGTFQLESDDVTGNESKIVGSTTTLQNSQCIIRTTSVTATALSTTITLDVTFKNAFTGLKNIYMYGADGDGSINTGWIQKGSWNLKQ
jgi:hypothetical protein